MSEELNLTVSKQFKIRAFALAATGWIGFNVVSGLITGNTDVIDNFFVLIVFMTVAAFKSSYNLRVVNHIVQISRINMATSTIDLSRLERVERREGKYATLHLNDGTRYTLHLSRFSADQQALLNQRIQKTDKTQPVLSESHGINQAVSALPDWKGSGPVGNIIGGCIAWAVAAYALLSGEAHTNLVAGGGHVSELSQSPQSFYSQVVIATILGFVFVAKGIYMLWRRRG